MIERSKYVTLLIYWRRGGGGEDMGDIYSKRHLGLQDAGSFSGQLPLNRIITIPLQRQVVFSHR